MTMGQLIRRWGSGAVVGLWLMSAAATAMADDQVDDPDETAVEDDAEIETVDGDEVDEAFDERQDETIDAPQLPEADLEAPEDADPEFEEQLENYRRAYERYATAIEQYQTAIENLVDTEFERRMAEIDAAYDPQIREAEVVERHQRDEAIESLEQFLEQYPADPDYTPDARFRLALLYERREDEEFAEAQREYFETLDEMDDDADFDEMPEAPRRSYDDSREQFEKLAARWPEYRSIDLVYYFLLNVEWEEGNHEQARDLAAELIRQAPDSEFVSDAWLIIGEYYFEFADKDGPEEIRDNLKLALEAFEEAGSETGRENLTDASYVRAVYSWAWAHYRLENFPEALAIFRDVVELIDQLATETGEQRTELRDDALVHLAEILSMDDWDMDDGEAVGYTVMDRVERYMSEGDDYEREVLVLLGEELFELTRYDDAVDVYEYVVEMDPLHPDNPDLHRQIVAALNRAFRDEEAVAVRREMIEHYGEGSAWYQHQQRMGNEAAIRDMEELVREYLLAAATTYHQQAQTMRNEGMIAEDSAMLEQARQTYDRAAESYKEFLRHFPNDPEIFQWNFQFAEALFYAERYPEAFEQYQVVRELDIPDNPYQERSAHRAIQAKEFVIQEKVERGELTAAALTGDASDEAEQAAAAVEEERALDDEEALEQVEVDAQPIPAIVEDYITSMDRYVVLGLENENEAYLGAIFAFRAANVFHDFEHYDESRTRFEWIVENYPDHEVGYAAGNRILESFRLENDFEGLAEWAHRLEGVIEGDQAEAVQEEVRQYRLMAMFNAAQDMLDEGRYEEAADEFNQMAREAPSDHELIPLALNNAAIAYERKGNREGAIDQYEKLFTEEPDHYLATRGVYQVALHSHQLFHFDKAVSHYDLFYDQFSGPTPPELEELNFDIEQNRERALVRSARMSMYLQRYQEAAEKSEQYFETYPDSANAEEMLWSATDAWEQAGETEEMVRVLDRYVDEFEADLDYTQELSDSERRIAIRTYEAEMRMARLYDERGDEHLADRSYRDIVDRYEDEWMEVEPQAPIQIRQIAAEARFTLVERDFEEWDAIVIEGTEAQQERLLEEKIDGIEPLTSQYQEVMDFGSFDWNLAAFFRIANVMQRTAEALYAVPPPYEEGTDEYWMYQDELDRIAFPLEDEAVNRYEQAMDRARERGVTNEWTERIREALNVFDDDQYPIYEQERRPRAQRVDEGIPVLTYEEYEARQKRRDDGGLESEAADTGAEELDEAESEDDS